jgi:hypothetical protein
MEILECNSKYFVTKFLKECDMLSLLFSGKNYDSSRSPKFKEFERSGLELTYPDAETRNNLPYLTLSIM